MVGDPGGALDRVMHQVIEEGPSSIARLSLEERAAVAAHLDRAYRVIFMLLAAITACGACVAFTVPKVRWDERR
jgi:hypothetical protein